MAGIVIEQAIFHREPDGGIHLTARSPGFGPDLEAAALQVIEGFGQRLVGVPCPAALFVQRLGKRSVAVVQVADQPRDSLDPALGFRFLVLNRKDYESSIGDPFFLADRLPPAWSGTGALEPIAWTEAPPPRTVADVQAVLKRVKASALREGEDPEHPDFERTPENSESPALLGGSQILVDGGRVVLERKGPDNDFVRGLWTLLPNRTRGRLYPATFAYSGALNFDMLVLPRLNLLEHIEGYSTEDMACDYPASTYELAVQRAAESNDQRALDSILNRRDSRETLRLAFILLIGMIVIVLGSSLFRRGDDQRAEKAAAAAGIVAVQDPWTVLALKLHGDGLWMPKK